MLHLLLQCLLLGLHLCVARTYAQDSYIGRTYRVSTGQYYNHSEIEYLQNRTVRAFRHTLSGYFNHAFPMEDLSPVSCTGSNELFKGTMVTLIDALDTMAVMGLDEDFRTTVGIIETHMPSFDLNVNVSVFEINIRVLGGLLSGHALAIDPDLGLYRSTRESYSGVLLRLAIDLGERLLVAFNTPTGIPYGTVNLSHGVPDGETPVTCTAGGGTFLLEFATLSEFSGDIRFEQAAKKSVFALFQRRDPTTGLVGTHINVISGMWTVQTASIGSYVDSFYEYLFKYWTMVPSREAGWSDSDDFLVMFLHLYQSALRNLKLGPWYMKAHMSGGTFSSHTFEALQGFWPGLQGLVGDMTMATSTLEAFMNVWDNFSGGAPDEFDLAVNSLVGGKERYALRPELVESAYHLSTISESHEWIEMGRAVLATLDQHCKTRCGYANIANVSSHEKEDRMESFFLSETLKYLYLLFSPDHWMRSSQKYVFSTEAHLLPVIRSAREECKQGSQWERLQGDGYHPRRRSAAEEGRAKLLLARVWGDQCKRVTQTYHAHSGSRDPASLATVQPFFAIGRKRWSTMVTSNTYADEVRWHDAEIVAAIDELGEFVAPLEPDLSQQRRQKRTTGILQRILESVLGGGNGMSLVTFLVGMTLQFLWKGSTNQRERRKRPTSSLPRTPKADEYDSNVIDTTAYQISKPAISCEDTDGLSEDSGSSTELLGNCSTNSAASLVDENVATYPNLATCANLVNMPSVECNYDTTTSNTSHSDEVDLAYFQVY